MKTIGILKEEGHDKRVCLLPEAVKKLSDKGYKVLFESHSGSGLGIMNVEYQRAGAICTTAEKIFDEADLVCSIKHRYDGETLSSEASFLGVFNPLFFPEELDRYNRWTTLYSLDLMPRSTFAQGMDVLSSMASLSGYKAVLMAANYSNLNLPMFTTAAGTIKPARVLVLGAGVAGLQAIATAKRLGAVVEAFDVRSQAGEEVRSLGAKFIEVDGAMESNTSEGYAVEQSDLFLKKQRQLIHDAAVQADIIICTANIPGKKAPILISESTTENLKKGTVIVDLASEQGGNCEVTQNNRILIQNGITIIGNSHFSKTIPLAASQLLSTNYSNYINLFFTNPEHELIQRTQVMAKGVIVHPKLTELTLKTSMQ